MTRMLSSTRMPTRRWPAASLNWTNKVWDMVTPSILLVGMLGNGRTARTDQEVEVAAFVSLQDAVDVELLVAALRRRRRLGRAHGQAGGDFRVAQVEVQGAGVAI